MVPVLRSRKIPVVVTDDYTIYLEPWAGLLWVHADVKKWTPRVKRDFRERLDRVLNATKQTVYAVNEIGGFGKRHKFMIMLGWEYYKFGAIPDGGVEKVHVYRRFLNG